MLANGYWLLATSSYLLSGPPASGKSRAALQRFLADPSATLLTPTATMAEHVRNELARKSLPIRPTRVLTLAQFIAPFTQFQETPDALLNLLIAQSDLSTFGASAHFPGFHRALAAVLGQVPDLPPQIAQIAAGIDHELSLRGYALREKRLSTAKPIASGPIILDGFFTFSPSELDLIENLAAQTPVTVTLPDWPGSTAARDRLLTSGFTEQRLDLPLRHPTRTVRAAPSLEQEVEQIALQIINYAASGRQFRQMGILLRVRDPYAPALESTLARFGIPARFHFADTLSAHPAIQYLTGLVRVALNGWDQAQLLTLLRMPISGIGTTPAGDVLDFAIRQALPSGALNIAETLLPENLQSENPQASLFCGAANFGGSRLFKRLAGWEQDRRTPPDWSAHLKTLRHLIPAPAITDQVDHQQLQIWRSTAAALNAFDQALDTAANALDADSKMALAAFWTNVESAVSVEKLRVPDRRRNVVNVLDVYEARQWELPIVFVCGLTERNFPQYHRQNPLLEITADRQPEERFLFELATSRATEETILSYARYNDKGDPQLRSFFLEQEGEPVGNPRPVARPVVQVGQIPHLPSSPNHPHSRLSPTSIESFLQCPYQFHAQRALKLRDRPEKPRDRLNTLLQGSILHRALAEGNLDDVFEEECHKHNIPPTYRKEAVRLELLRHFEAFQADHQWLLEWPGRKEEKFLIQLTPDLSISGRIDVLLTGPHHEAIVIDYKYSAAAKIRERVESDPIQGGLYLSAVRRFFKLHPAGMFYCGLRQSVTWEGWHANIPGLNLGEKRTDLSELIDSAEATAVAVHESIISGNIEVRPADRAKCRYCAFTDICRKESIIQASTA